MADPRTAYADHADAASAPPICDIERGLLSDLLDNVGPDHPTLCDGWDTHHLAAHIRNREAGPAGQVRQVFAGMGAQALEATVANTAYPDLVAAIRNGPPLLTVFALPKLGSLMNDLEFFVHHEDVLRAADGWQARVLPEWAEDVLWRRAAGAGKLFYRRSKQGIVLERSDTSATAEISSGDDEVVVSGRPSELTMYLFGRREVADVSITGSDDALTRFTRKQNRV